jgi:hypothetical protein
LKINLRVNKKIHTFVKQNTAMKKREFELGDKVFDILFGWGEVVRVHNEEEMSFPIVVQFETYKHTYTKEGVFSLAHKNPTLSHCEYSREGVVISIPTNKWVVVNGKPFYVASYTKWKEDSYKLSGWGFSYNGDYWTRDIYVTTSMIGQLVEASEELIEEAAREYIIHNKYVGSPIEIMVGNAKGECSDIEIPYHFDVRIVGGDIKISFTDSEIYNSLTMLHEGAWAKRMRSTQLVTVEEAEELLTKALGKKHVILTY